MSVMSPAQTPQRSIGRDLWWKQRVGAAQDVEHLALILAKSGLVSKPSKARRK